MATNRVVTIQKPTQIPGFVVMFIAGTKDALQEWAVVNGVTKAYWARKRKVAYVSQAHIAHIKQVFICSSCNLASIESTCAICGRMCVVSQAQMEVLHAIE